MSQMWTEIPEYLSIKENIHPLFLQFLIPPPAYMYAAS